MLNYDYDKVVMENGNHVFEYQNNKLKITNTNDNLISTYNINNMRDYEIEINFLIKMWVVCNEVITIEHIEFINKIKEMIDIKKFAECNYDYITFALSED